jgi:very-short-patch-repair endonuclease
MFPGTEGNNEEVQFDAAFSPRIMSTFPQKLCKTIDFPFSLFVYLGLSLVVTPFLAMGYFCIAAISCFFFADEASASRRSTKPAALGDEITGSKAPNVPGSIVTVVEGSRTPEPSKPAPSPPSFHYHAICGSEPERILLTELIASGCLSPGTRNTMVGEYTLALQAQLGMHRVDFLVNNRLVVEVDGHQWHKDRFYEDRERDQYLIERGYTVIRFPARQVFRDPKSCVVKIERSLRQQR